MCWSNTIWPHHGATSHRSDGLRGNANMSGFLGRETDQDGARWLREWEGLHRGRLVLLAGFWPSSRRTLAREPASSPPAAYLSRPCSPTGRGGALLGKVRRAVPTRATSPSRGGPCQSLAGIQ